MSNGIVTIINTTPYKSQPVPEVGKEYHVFDDGKIKPSRHHIVTITEVIPFRECDDNKLMSNWAEEVTDCYWLYANETDYFVKATAVYSENPQYFVRTTDGGWFSLGFFGARLDIDCSLYSNMIKEFGED